MNVYGRTTVSEFLGDLLVYRNLVPVDERLMGLEQTRDTLGLPSAYVPRKSEPDYARVIVHMLNQARALDAPGSAIARLVYVGDTRLNDGTAFYHICQAGGWPGLAFIASEANEPATVEVVNATTSAPIGQHDGEARLFLTNRWGALADFDTFCGEQEFPVDRGTAVIIDLDKTALGARGRNAHVIDQARVLAVRRTVADLLGAAFDPKAFETAYDLLNQPEFHPFTADNQDYLAYICLILGGGLYELEEVVADVRGGNLHSFGTFITQVDGRRTELAPDLRAMHDDIYAYVRTGDPTPFKAFRYNEFLTTVASMGNKREPVTAEELLAEEIVITQEVRTQALAWKDRGALLFGLSDKPDEASLPSAELSEQGYLAIHRTETHAVGG